MPANKPLNLAQRLARSPAPVRIASFLLVLLVLWLPWVGLVYWRVNDLNTISILTMSVLFVEFFVLLWVWGRRIYGRSHPIRGYGLWLTRTNGLDLLHGLAQGVGGLFSLFGIKWALGWTVWQAAISPKIAVEGLLVALAFGLMEELIFRGWLLDELERDYAPQRSLWIGAIAFAVLHFIRPLSEMVRTFPQFPGLVLLGLALIWGKRGSQGRLGFSIGLHGGLIWGFYMVNVGQMTQTTGQVPTWITGIDGNPLAGVLGFICLSTIAGYCYWRSHR
jgi:membrane protease YdiL (CAAX protease family)